MVAAVAISGRLDFNPITDSLTNVNGESVMLAEPTDRLPVSGFAVEDNGYQAPASDGSGIEVGERRLNRLQLLTHLILDGQNINGAKLLIKALGKCTTDHISMESMVAFPWAFNNISNNCLIGV